MVIGGFFLYASYYGTDQTQTQRMLSAKGLPTIKSLLMANGIFRFPVTLTYCIMGLIIGTLLMTDMSFQEQISDVYAANIDSLEGKKEDLMIPVFIIKYLPNGIIGILLVAIMSAAMSSLSSTVNSLSAVTIEDFVKRFKGEMSDKQYVRYSRFTSIFWGLVCLFFAFFAGNIEGTVIEVINKVSSIFYGPILAAFVLALVTKRTHALGANIGILAGVLFNMYLWLYVPEVFWFWWNAIGCLVTLSVAYLVSILIPMKTKEGIKMYLYPAWKEVAILVGYFVLIVLVSMSLKDWLT